jgi:hypothetical protein
MVPAVMPAAIAAEKSAFTSNGTSRMPGSGKETLDMKKIKDTLRFDCDGLTATEVGEFIKKKVGSLRCPEHNDAVAYDPAKASYDTAQHVVRGQCSLPVEYCCAKLRDRAWGISPKRA